MLQISPYRSGDHASILEIYRPYIETGAVSFEQEVPTLQAFADRLENIASKFPFMVLRDGDQILGYAYASTHRERVAYRWAVETSIYMAPESKGKGLGFVLYSRLLGELELRGFTHSFGIIAMPNDASAQLHAKCGFLHLALHEKAGWKMGSWHDVLWMRKELAAPQNPPAEPIFGPWEAAVNIP